MDGPDKVAVLAFGTVIGRSRQRPASAASGHLKLAISLQNSGPQSILAGIPHAQARTLIPIPENSQFLLAIHSILAALPPKLRPLFRSKAA